MKSEVIRAAKGVEGSAVGGAENRGRHWRRENGVSSEPREIKKRMLQDGIGGNDLKVAVQEGANGAGNIHRYMVAR